MGVLERVRRGVYELLLLLAPWYMCILNIKMACKIYSISISFCMVKTTLAIIISAHVFVSRDWSLNLPLYFLWVQNFCAKVNDESAARNCNDCFEIVRGWFPLHVIECQGSHFSFLKKLENQSDWLTNARHILDVQQKMRYYKVMKLKQCVVLER